MAGLAKEFTKGLTIENPTFALVLGLCPTLAVSNSVNNAVGMGIAATFVLLGSNTMVSLLRRFIPERIRLPAYIVIIAAFVTICELVIKAYFPRLDEALGIFVPLIVVNCIIMGRAEAFASRNALLPSVFDALGMGVGFTLSLCLIAVIRELLGAGSIAGVKLISGFEPATMMILAPGALLTLGLLIALTNFLRLRHGKPALNKDGGCCL